MDKYLKLSYKIHSVKWWSVIILMINLYFIVFIINYTKMNIAAHNTFKVYLKDLFSSFKITIKILFFLVYLFYTEKSKTFNNILSVYGRF